MVMLFRFKLKDSTKTGFCPVFKLISEDLCLRRGNHVILSLLLKYRSKQAIEHSSDQTAGWND
jgi:hypothetical protein